MATRINPKKSDIGAELEKKALLKQAGFSKSQQEILKQMKKQSEEQVDSKLTSSLNKAFASVDEEGNRIIDTITSRVATQLLNKDDISLKELNELRVALGENNTNVNVNANVSGKVDIQAELKKLSSESEF